MENELIEEVKAHSEITVATLNKIGLKKAVLKKMRWMMLVLEQVQLLRSLLEKIWGVKNSFTLVLSN